MLLKNVNVLTLWNWQEADQNQSALVGLLGNVFYITNQEIDRVLSGAGRAAAPRIVDSDGGCGSVGGGAGSVG